MRKVEFHRTFAAAHRIWNDDSPCRNIHGHNYTVDVFIETDHELNEQGFVIPFDSLKAQIDQLDHCLILDRDDPIKRYVASYMDGDGHVLQVAFIDGPPSTENVADYLAQEVAMALSIWRQGMKGHVLVKLTEGPSIAAWGEAWVPT
jgi:6-pyruvoyltetrahydropterin/6-carboxytetrahydropterin synthase